jgi:hypothetical protein
MLPVSRPISPPSRWVFLLLILLALNSYVFSFSKMKTLQNVRLLFWIGGPLISLAWYLALYRQRPLYSLGVLLALGAIFLRLLYGSYGVSFGFCNAFSNSDFKLPRIHAVVFTEENSARGDYVKEVSLSLCLFSWEEFRVRLAQQALYRPSVCLRM